MADPVNGQSKPDVEMKEEGAEFPINPVQAVPPFSFQTEAQGAEEATDTVVNGALTQSNGLQESQASAPVQPGDVPVVEPPIASPIPAVNAPAPSLSSTQAQAPLSAPTPPAARESSRPSSIPPPGIAPPERPNAHGSPTRVYLNQNVTPHLLEGMKYLAAYEPDKPLKWLSEFLANRSAETERDL